jgi:cytochrome P450
MHILINDKTLSTLSDDEIIWECTTFLIAGAATVASTMENLLYYVSVDNKY